jgi:hypothetical protein
MARLLLLAQCDLFAINRYACWRNDAQADDAPGYLHDLDSNPATNDDLLADLARQTKHVFLLSPGKPMACRD